MLYRKLRYCYLVWLRFFLFVQVLYLIVIHSMADVVHFGIVDIVLAMLWWRRPLRLAFAKPLFTSARPAFEDEFHEFS